MIVPRQTISQSLESKPYNLEITSDEGRQEPTEASPSKVLELEETAVVLDGLNKSPKDHLQTLFSFPMNSNNSISITSNDKARLEDGVFLNDSIIDLFLRYITINGLCVEAHIFSSFFFTGLKLHKTISRTHFNIFEKKFLLVPISEK